MGEKAEFSEKIQHYRNRIALLRTTAIAYTLAEMMMKLYISTENTMQNTSTFDNVEGN